MPPAKPFFLCTLGLHIETWQAVLIIKHQCKTSLSAQHSYPDVRAKTNSLISALCGLLISGAGEWGRQPMKRHAFCIVSPSWHHHTRVLDPPHPHPHTHTHTYPVLSKYLEVCSGGTQLCVVLTTDSWSQACRPNTHTHHTPLVVQTRQDRIHELFPGGPAVGDECAVVIVWKGSSYYPYGQECAVYSEVTQDYIKHWPASQTFSLSLMSMGISLSTNLCLLINIYSLIPPTFLVIYLWEQSFPHALVFFVLSFLFLTALAFFCFGSLLDITRYSWPSLHFYPLLCLSLPPHALSPSLILI